jgi:pimeloyl-ACP methyl ester carboxylesterase/DNA-binding CsgD family transcriptional regulator
MPRSNPLTYGCAVGICSASSPGGPGRIPPLAGAGRAVGLEQAIGFLPHRGGRVAYAVVGGGPALLLDLGRAHDLEAFWRHPAYRRFVQRLGRRFTVVRWDRPGFGLSDRDGAHLSLEAELALIEHLARHLGLEDARALAADDGGPVMVQFAARQPGRVSRLALFGTSAEGRWLSSPLPPKALRALRAPGSLAIHAVLAAVISGGCQPEVGRWLASAFAGAADDATMVRLMVETRRLDARPVLPLVAALTLVLHRERDPVVAPALGRKLAAGIAGAEFVALAGTAHLVYEGDVEQVLQAVIPFLAGGSQGEPAREPAALSQREVEVVRMVTLGLTSAEIGRRLAIRRRTVEAHLEHIRAKLGVRSRSRIAAWAVANHVGDVAMQMAAWAPALVAATSGRGLCP